MKTSSRTTRAREYHATEVILIGCLPEMSSHQKSGRKTSRRGFFSIRLYFSFRVSAGMGLLSETKTEPERRLNCTQLHDTTSYCATSIFPTIKSSLKSPAYNIVTYLNLHVHETSDTCHNRPPNSICV